MKFLSRPRLATPAFALTALLLALGLVPLPKGSWSRWIRQNARSQELNRAERTATEAGYYEGLINVGADSGRGGLAESLLGSRSDWVSFHDIGATRYLFGDVLQFELREDLRRVAFGKPFSTSAVGLRDRDYARVKPPGVYRIAVLGSSIDMGWGVGDGETYEALLEDWLNGHAEKVGAPRRFEVLNFAMAAYSPVHRREAYRRKAVLMGADLVVFSATTLDTRLTQIHLCGLLQDRVSLAAHPELREAVLDAGVTPDDLRLAPDGSLLDRNTLKAKIDGQLWPVIDRTLGLLAEDCRAASTPMLALMVPRAGGSDTPKERAAEVARYRATIAAHGIPTIDLTAAFDDEDPAAVSVAPRDDHPNTLGHHLLFLSLAQAIVDDSALYRRLFERDVPETATHPRLAHADDPEPRDP